MILLEDVERLGKAGDVKEVRSGYGFNFLLPQGLAEFATETALKESEKSIARRHQVTGALVDTFKKQAAELAGKKVTIKTKAEKGKLFGSVGSEEVADALKAAGIAVDAKIIVMEKPFKETGTFPVEAHFGHGVKVSFEVMIEAE